MFQPVSKDGLMSLCIILVSYREKMYCSRLAPKEKFSIIVVHFLFAKAIVLSVIYSKFYIFLSRKKKSANN